jgi:hypothetical protein
MKDENGKKRKRNHACYNGVKHGGNFHNKPQK